MFMSKIFKPNPVYTYTKHDLDEIRIIGLKDDDIIFRDYTGDSDPGIHSMVCLFLLKLSTAISQNDPLTLKECQNVIEESLKNPDPYHNEVIYTSTYKIVTGIKCLYVPLDQLPLYINHPDETFRKIVKWRLTKGK